MPIFCNACRDVTGLAKASFNLKLALIVSIVFTVIFAVIWWLLFPIGFLIGLFVYYKFMYANQKPFCSRCHGYNYSVIAPHEAESLRREAEHKKALEQSDAEHKKSMEQMMEMQRLSMQQQMTSTAPQQQVITREIVKIPCKYCSQLIDNTSSKCPSCGASTR